MNWIEIEGITRRKVKKDAYRRNKEEKGKGESSHWHTHAILRGHRRRTPLIEVVVLGNTIGRSGHLGLKVSNEALSQTRLTHRNFSIAG